MELRQYQKDLIEKLREALRIHRSVLMVSPTGSGKTVMFNHMVEGAQRKGKRVLIVVHREELIYQTSAGLSVPHGIISPRERHTDDLVQIAMVQTLVNRLKRMEATPDLIVVDEAHHAVPGSGWGKVLDHWESSRVVGATATPQRLDGRGLGRVAGGYFDELVEGPTTSFLTELGFLSPSIAFGPPEQLNLADIRKTGGDYNLHDLEEAMGSRVITGDVIKHYERHMRRMPAIGFTVSIADAHRRAEDFKMAGYRAAALSGETNQHERAKMIHDLGTGQLEVLFSCGVVSEGTDIPAVAGALLLRPTTSLALALQQMGRALRPFPGKKHAVILDHAGNIERHGLPSTPREWTLEGAEKKNRKQTESSPVKQCKTCYAWVPSQTKVCQYCDTPLTKESIKQINEVGDNLVVIDEYVFNKRRESARMQAKARTYEALVELGRKRGHRYPEAWARHVMRARDGKRQRQ